MIPRNGHASECQVLQQGQLREFFGFNRAKHAVLEAAILATRTSFIPSGEILSQMKHLKVIVERRQEAIKPRHSNCWNSLLPHNLADAVKRAGWKVCRIVFESSDG